ncbi:MAG: FAD-binding oxidoreductase [Promethearchaeota archaeon]
MGNDIIFQKLVKICGSKNVSNDPEILANYSKDMSFIQEKMPISIVWPSNTNKIEEIVKLANLEKFSIIPISSNKGPRHHGDTIPHKDNCVVLDLSNMKKILNIDRKNRVVMIEPGVTFSNLIPKLQNKGLRLLLPLHPRNSKSVLTSALEREPITIPRYHWDSSDPLLCTEVFFGTGDLFRTGTAAGPGTIKEQQATGQAQVNPMGPTQFSPFRVIQGAQGSLGIVTWATLKLELIPTIQKVVHLQSDTIAELLDLQHELIKYRLCDELLILNNLNLAILIKKNSQEIIELAKTIKKYNLIYVLAGRGKLANDKIAYLEGDIKDIIKNLGHDDLVSRSSINDSEILQVLSQTTEYPWRLRLKGGYQDIFFITNLEKIMEFISLVEREIPQDLGIYIQPINQGTSYHCEFDLYYDPTSDEEIKNIKEKFLEISIKLMDSGAFFNRPYGILTKEVYKRHNDSTQMALRRVKKIFDPNNVLNPGVLCFED